jgi:hypothetical protein
MYTMKLPLSAMIAIALLLPVPALMGEGATIATRGVQDAYISGKVLNATAGYVVYASATDPKTSTFRNFTALTDPQGRFFLTVDSEPTILIPYSVTIRESYYQVPTRGTYIFPNPINSSETATVPDGSLELNDAVLGDLKVIILNGSSMQPLPGAIVDISADSVPDPPFPTAKVSDAQGSVFYLGIRATNTTVKATKVNFKSLDQSTEHDYIEVAPIVLTNGTFVLTERPWPFTVNVKDGDIDVNHTIDIIVDFKQEMDRTSIEDGTAITLRSGSEPPVQATLAAIDGNTKVRISPDLPLDYSTEYTLRIDTSVMTKVGANLLWRAMEVTFATELPPAVILGRIVDSKTFGPVEGVTVKLKSLQTRSDEEGTFAFPIVVPGEYRVNASESYLYFSNETVDFVVGKGDVLDLGDIAVDPRVTGSLSVNIRNEYKPLEGAYVSIQNSDLNFTTDEDGNAFFPRTRVGLVTVYAGAPHHSTELEMAQVQAGRTSNLNITLEEDPTPVIVEPTVKVGTKVGVTSSFKLIMPYAIQFSTLTSDLWMVDDDLDHLEEVDLLPISAGTEPNTYIVKPTASLRMERAYLLSVGSSLRKEGSSDQVLWDDLFFRFETPDHPLSYSIGTVLLDGKPFSGMEVMLGEFSGITGPDGRFNVTVDLHDPVLEGVLSIDSEPWGYSSQDIHLSLSAGTVFNVGTLDLSMVPGRYLVEPADGSVGVDPGTNISFTFSDPVASVSGLNALLSVVRGDDSTMIPGEIHLLNDNLTAVLDPTYPLEEGKSYSVMVSDELMLKTGYPACPVGKETSFNVRLPKVRTSLVEPSEGVLGSLPLDRSLVLSFSMAVNKTMVAEVLNILPAPTNMALTWNNPKELEITMFLLPSMDYDLDIPTSNIGSRGEMMEASYHLDFRTGNNYSLPHTHSSFSIYPDPQKDIAPGQNLTLTGMIEDSVGYLVTVIIKGVGFEKTYTTYVEDDGSYQLSIPVPGSKGEYTMTISVGMPGAPSAIQPMSYTLKVASLDEGDDQNDDGGLLTMAIIGIILLILCIIVTAAVLWIFAQRRRAEQEIGSREYDEVDMDVEE